MPENRAFYGGVVWIYMDILIKYYIEKNYVTKLGSTDLEVLEIKFNFSFTEAYCLKMALATKWAYCTLKPIEKTVDFLTLWSN